jgi:hypothetical protein
MCRLVKKIVRYTVCWDDVVEGHEVRFPARSCCPLRRDAIIFNASGSHCFVFITTRIISGSIVGKKTVKSGRSIGRTKVPVRMAAGVSANVQSCERFRRESGSLTLIHFPGRITAVPEITTRWALCVKCTDRERRRMDASESRQGEEKSRKSTCPASICMGSAAYHYCPTILSDVASVCSRFFACVCGLAELPEESRNDGDVSD